MTRLTRRDADGNALAFNYVSTRGECKQLIDRLAEYEDIGEAEELALLKENLFTAISTIELLKILCGQYKRLYMQLEAETNKRMERRGEEIWTAM
jgi:hypothetical protein